MPSLFPLIQMRDLLVSHLREHNLPDWLVPDYWFMVTTAIIVACFITLYLWRDRGPRRTASNLLFWGILALFGGAKLFYYLQFGFPESLACFWASAGLSLYGGLFGLLTAWTLYYLIRPYSLLDFLDCVTPALALGLFFGRIGCFLAGCNGGTVSHLTWAVSFPRETSLFYHQLQAGLVQESDKLTLPVHPTQIYESLFGLLAFALLLILFRRRRWAGQVFLTGMLWYALFRFFTEPLRFDTGGIHPFGLLTFAQMVSVIVFAAAAGGLILLRSRS